LKKIINSKIFHNFSWLFADKLIRLALSLFVSIVVARYLGPERFGLWNYLFSFSLFFMVFSSMGLDGIIPRELIKQPENSKAIISTGAVIKFLGGLTGFALNILVFFLYKNPDTELFMMMSLMASILIFQSFDIFDIVFKSRLQAKYSVIGRNMAFVIVALLKLYFVYYQFPIIFFIGTNALETLIGAVLVYFIYIIKGNRIYLKSFEWRLAKRLLSDGFPMAISSFMVMIYMRIDQVMLTDMSGLRQNGIYATGVRMIEIVYFIPVALGDSFFPGIVYSKKHEGKKYYSNLLGFYSIMTYVAIFISIVTIIIAVPMMNLLFGEQFEGSGKVVQIFGFSLYATFLSVATGKYLVTENYLKIILTRSFLGLSMNIFLNWLWIPEYGYIGAAYASFVSYFVPLLALLFFAPGRQQLFLVIKAFNPKYLIRKLRGA
jgi:O-antigen/teichoic acid export membrane protein